MNSLYLDLKTRYGQAEIHLLDSETIEVNFNRAKESVIIQRGEEQGRYTVSYPQVVVNHSQKKDDYTTSHKVLKEGVLWVLNKVNKNGKVLPEF